LKTLDRCRSAAWNREKYRSDRVYLQILRASRDPQGHPGDNGWAMEFYDVSVRTGVRRGDVRQLRSLSPSRRVPRSHTA